LKRLAVLGASGHGKVVADAARESGWTEIVFYDDAWPGRSTIGPWPIAGGRDALLAGRDGLAGVVIAIGNNATRLRRQQELAGAGLPIVSVIHPSAVVSESATVGIGSVIFACAVVGAFASIGEGCIVNTGATIDHDCVLADGVHLSPGAHLGGEVRVGEASWLGIGCAVRHGLVIGSGVMVGAGAAVVADVEDGLTVVGVPARPLRNAAGPS